MMNVALNVRRRLQSYHYPPDDPRDLTAHDHPLGGDSAGDPSLFADDDLAAPDIALDFAVDLERALADDLEPLADDLEIITNDRLGSRFDRTDAWWLLLRRLSGVGADRFERLRLGGRVAREHGSLSRIRIDG